MAQTCEARAKVERRWHRGAIVRLAVSVVTCCFWRVCVCVRVHGTAMRSKGAGSKGRGAKGRGAKGRGASSNGFR